MRRRVLFPVLCVFLAACGIERAILVDSTDSLVLIGGDNQKAKVGQPLTDLLVVQALNPAGNPIPGALVHFSVLMGDAALAVSDVTTDGNGWAINALTLGKKAGPVQVKAELLPGASEAPPRSVFFDLQAEPGTSARIDPVSAPASTAVCREYAWGVALVDAEGNGIPSKRLRVEADNQLVNGESGPVWVDTDANGRAVFRLTSPAATGSSTVVVRDETGLVFATQVQIVWGIELVSLSGSEATQSPGESLFDPVIQVRNGCSALAGHPLRFNLTTEEAFSLPTPSSGKAVNADSLGILDGDYIHAGVEASVERYYVDYRVDDGAESDTFRFTIRVR